MGNIVKGQYSFSDEWKACDEKRGLSYVYCKASTIGTAPTKFAASGFFGGARETASAVTNVGAELVGQVWKEIKMPFILGGALIVLILILK